MGLISVRLDDEDERFLRRRRLPLSELIREAVHSRVHQMRALDALAELESVRWKAGEPVERTIRRLRDADSVRD